MPAAATTDIEIAQKAMILAGAEPIQTFDDTGDDAAVMRALYEEIVRDALSEHRWKFNTAEIQLVRSADEPLIGTVSAYALPEDVAVLLPEMVHVNDKKATYHIRGRYVYVDAGEDDTVVLTCQWRQAVQHWQPQFTMFVIFKVASIVAMAIRDNAAAGETFLKLADDAKMRARLRDSQQQTTQGIAVTRFRTARRGRSVD